MPDAFPATIAEREAELLALQGAFDEYIASSRELEEELDAELAKMRKFYLQVCLRVESVSGCCCRAESQSHIHTPHGGSFFRKDTRRRIAVELKSVTCISVFQSCFGSISRFYSVFQICFVTTFFDMFRENRKSHRKRDHSIIIVAALTLF
jgi:hypothetical protein